VDPLHRFDRGVPVERFEHAAGDDRAPIGAAVNLVDLDGDRWVRTHPLDLRPHQAVAVEGLTIVGVGDRDDTRPAEAIDVGDAGDDLFVEQ
jgi:hypothetical protein